MYLSSMKKWRKHPVIYEINTWVWLEELGRIHNAFIDLSNVPGETWDSLAALKTDAIWLMGVWERSPVGRQISNRNEGNIKDFYRALPDFQPEDNVGSPYCVRNYTVDAHLGGDTGLAMARDQLARRGIRLILDFVPNHLAHDHPWVDLYPECFIQGGIEEIEKDAVTFTRIGDRIFACGKDPYYPAWQDVIQVNAFHPQYRTMAAKSVKSIASRCDGIRCDMAMLLMNDIFEKTWGSYAGSRPQEEYWTALIREVKALHPDFLFLAEAYWDLEWELQQQGFDFCYDKRLYDRLENGNVPEIRMHLKADQEYQSKLLRFIENHDEPRAAKVFRSDKRKAAFLAIATLPGARLFYEGQFEGRRTKLPVFLCRRPGEEVDREMLLYYQQIMNIIALPAFHDGQWQLCETGGWVDNDHYQYILAWTWKWENEKYLAVINYRDEESQAKVRLPWQELGQKKWKLVDLLSGVEYERSGDEMLQPGLYIGLPAWGVNLFSLNEI